MHHFTAFVCSTSLGVVMYSVGIPPVPLLVTLGFAAVCMGLYAEASAECIMKRREAIARRARINRKVVG